MNSAHSSAMRSGRLLFVRWETGDGAITSTRHMLKSLCSENVRDTFFAGGECRNKSLQGSNLARFDIAEGLSCSVRAAKLAVYAVYVRIAQT